MNQSKIRVIASPEERVFGELLLQNPTDKPKNIRLYLEDWRYLPDATGAKEFLPASSTPLSACPWMDFSPGEVHIPPYGKQRINYSISIPKEASGARYASLFFETLVTEKLSTDKIDSAGLDITVRVATLFYVEVKGSAERKAKIDNLKIVKDNKDALIISLDFENTGNTDITTSATFNLMDKKGKIYARGAFNELYTFLGGKGILQGIWKEQIPKGTYDLVVTIDLGKALIDAKIGRGPVITKEALVTIGENNQVVQIGQLQ
jgi:hypothetical protein